MRDVAVLCWAWRLLSSEVMDVRRVVRVWRAVWAVASSVRRVSRVLLGLPVVVGAGVGAALVLLDERFAPGSGDGAGGEWLAGSLVVVVEEKVAVRSARRVSAGSSRQARYKTFNCVK